MESARPPLVYGFLAVHGRLPPYSQPSHELFQKFEVDDIVLNDQDIDWRDCAVKQAC